MAENEQAVAEKTDAAPAGQTEGEGAQVDELDQVLAQYDAETEDDSTETKGPQDASDPVSQRLEQLERQVTQQQTQEALGKLVNTVRGDLDAETFDNDLVEGWIEKIATREPRIMKAWANRERDPKGFSKVAGSLAKQFQSKFSNAPDRQVTEDREAVASAARSASTRSDASDMPSDKEIAHMTDQEFFALKNKLRRS